MNTRARPLSLPPGSPAQRCRSARGWPRFGVGVVAFSTLTAAASDAAAQNRSCDLLRPASGRIANVCDAAVDATRALHPTAGLLAGGGNPGLAAAPPLGRLGAFSGGVRVNFVRVQLPDLSYNGVSPVVPAGEVRVVPATIVDIAAGLYRGLPGGLFAVDILGSVQLLPADAVENLHLSDGATHLGSLALGLGYGVRVGLARGSVWPSIGLTVARRDLPRVRYGDLREPDQEYQYDVDFAATSFRLVAGRPVGAVTVTAGVGLDRYSGSARIGMRELDLPVDLVGEIGVPLAHTRAVVFLSPSLQLPPFALAAEVGHQFGKELDLATTFEDYDPSSGRWFGGIGLRVSP